MLNHRPCETCKSDTLHYGTKCQTCGTITVPNTVASGRRRIQAKYMAHKGMAGKERYYALRERVGIERARYLKREGRRFADTPLKRGSSV